MGFPQWELDLMSSQYLQKSEQKAYLQMCMKIFWHNQKCVVRLYKLF